MKHFYSFSLLFIAMFSAQIVIAQSNIVANNMDIVASRIDFNNSDISLTQSDVDFIEINRGKSFTAKEKRDISASAQYSSADFRIFSENAERVFKASFIAPKSGKAILQVKTISGQVIYNENIEVIKGSNSQLIESADLKSGMYLVSVINEQVNYNGKLQKM